MKLTIRVIPNASRSEIVEWRNGILKVRLKAPPIDGKANEELCRFLGTIFDIAPSLIEIERGSMSKRKRVHISLTLEEVERVLHPFHLDSTDDSV